jgi:putative phosphoribosyl transferase
MRGNLLVEMLTVGGTRSAGPRDMRVPFRDRREAGRRLTNELQSYAGRPGVIVLALPRGGVPVAYEIAQALRAPLDVFIVRKLGVPRHEELAMGALASGGVRVLDRDIIRAMQVSEAEIARVTENEEQELERRERRYRGNRPLPDVEGKTVIIVDDGLATGATMRAALQALRNRNPARLVVSVPVAAAETCKDLRAIADEIVCAETPEPFSAVGAWYQDFSETTDEEVRRLVSDSATRSAARRLGDSALS